METSAAAHPPKAATRPPHEEDHLQDKIVYDLTPKQYNLTPPQHDLTQRPKTHDITPTT